DARPVYDGGQRVSKGNEAYSRRLFRFWAEVQEQAPQPCCAEAASRKSGTLSVYRVPIEQQESAARM
ncbi:MAG: hypothetical protein ACKPKO_20390, partial [Candidatus Fonsibacter sp.]